MICLRMFLPGAATNSYCGPHCRRIAFRLRQGDPTAPAALAMLLDPPNCPGCGEPLWAMRPDALRHPRCARAARRHAVTRVSIADMAGRPVVPLPRGALSPEEAAAWLGIARSTFYAEVLGDLKVVQIGRRKLIPVRELERWLDRRASYPLGGPR